MNGTVTVEELNSEEVGRLVPLLIYLGLIAGTGIPGNTIVCLVYRETSKRSVTRFFIWWLAVIDVISCFVLFLEIFNVVNQLTYTNAWLCKFTIFFTIWPVITSGLGLCLISIDRFRRVCRPLKRQISHKQARIMCMGTVIIALLFSWPSLIFFGTYETHISDYNVTSMACTIQNKYQGTTYTLVFNGLLWILFMSVLVFMCVVYIVVGKTIFTQMDRPASDAARCEQERKIETISGDDNTTDTSSAFIKSNQTLSMDQLRSVRKQSTISRHSNRLRVSSKRQTKAKKSAFIMFLISFVFLVSFLPYLILRINQAFDSTFVQSMTDTSRAFCKFFLRTYFLNCAVNPVIYCACAGAFRREVRVFFRRLSSSVRQIFAMA